METAATEFQRRFHISADTEHANQHTVTTLSYTEYRFNYNYRELTNTTIMPLGIDNSYNNYGFNIHCNLNGIFHVMKWQIEIAKFIAVHNENLHAHSFCKSGIIFVI